jgi:hypothetical protein
MQSNLQILCFPFPKSQIKDAFLKHQDKLKKDGAAAIFF